MRKTLIAILLALALTVVPAAGVFAATTADVTVTATPTYIAITNTEASWAVGNVDESTKYWWTADDLAPAEPFVDGDMKSTITNTGSVAEDIDVEAIDFTGGLGWTLVAASPVANEVVLAAGATGYANEAAMLELIDATPQELTSNLAAAGTIMWCMKLETGTFGDGALKTSTVTLTATEYVP